MRCLDAPNFESLKLSIKLGDAKSIFVQGADAITFAGFGGAGNPNIIVSQNILMDNNKWAGRLPGHCIRYFSESLITASQTEQKIHDIRRGYFVRSLLLKTGIKATTVTAGNNAYLTYTNAALANLAIMRGLNQEIRGKYVDMTAIAEETARRYGLPGAVATGYSLLDFAPNGVAAPASSPERTCLAIFKPGCRFSSFSAPS